MQPGWEAGIRALPLSGHLEAGNVLKFKSKCYLSLVLPFIYTLRFASIRETLSLINFTEQEVRRPLS